MSVLFPAMRGVGDMDALLSKPVSFAEYMKVFSDNYKRLSELLGGSFESARLGDDRAYVDFARVAANEYTTAMRVSYRVLSDDGKPMVAPLDAVLYIYCDTWQVELVKPVGMLRRQLRPYEMLGAVVYKWVLNAFLNRALRTIAARFADADGKLFLNDNLDEETK